MPTTRRDPQKRDERRATGARSTTQNYYDAKASTTRDQRRAYLLDAMAGASVLSFADGRARLRARLDALLLDEAPDQQAEARAWGDR